MCSFCLLGTLPCPSSSPSKTPFSVHKFLSLGYSLLEKKKKIRKAGLLQSFALIVLFWARRLTVVNHPFEGRPDAFDSFFGSFFLPLVIYVLILTLLLSFVSCLKVYTCLCFHSEETSFYSAQLFPSFFVP